MVLRQKLEAEKVELKIEQNKLDQERLADEKERMSAENERFLKLFDTNVRRRGMEQMRLDIDAVERKRYAKDVSKVVDVLVILPEQLKKM